MQSYSPVKYICSPLETSLVRSEGKTYERSLPLSFYRSVLIMNEVFQCPSQFFLGNTPDRQNNGKLQRSFSYSETEWLRSPLSEPSISSLQSVVAVPENTLLVKGCSILASGWRQACFSMPIAMYRSRVYSQSAVCEGVVSCLPRPQATPSAGRLDPCVIICCMGTTHNRYLSGTCHAIISIHALRRVVKN